MSQLTLIAPVVVRIVIRDGESRASALDRAAAAFAGGLDSLCNASGSQEAMVSIAARGKIRIGWDNGTTFHEADREHPVATTAPER